MARLSIEQRGIAVRLINAGMRQAQMSVNFNLLVEIICIITMTFLFSYNRKNQTQMNNVFPFLSSCCLY